MLRIRALALEQSIEMPLEAVDDAFVRDEAVARVDEIDELEPGRFHVVLGISTATLATSSGGRCSRWGFCASSTPSAIGPSYPTRRR